jgi:hypothetical protein
VHLEDEVFSVQGREGWSRCRDEEIPRQGGRICPGFIAADVSPTPQSEQGVEKIQGED